MNVSDILTRLDNVRGRTARCPAHDDTTNSLSVSEGDDGRVLLHCHAGCATEAVVSTLGLEMRDLFPKGRRGAGSSASSSGTATLQHSPRPAPATPLGCTLTAYAEAKRLPPDFLKSLGLRQVTYDDAPAVRIPYRRPDGTEGPIRFRVGLTKGGGNDRFRWKSGSRPMLYGLDRLDQGREAGYVVVLEGESDTQTSWYHGVPALGVPGAAHWKDERDAQYLDGIERIYVVIEPDQGGEALLKAIGNSRIRDRVWFVTLPGFKDVSEMHVDHPDQFLERWQAAVDAAVPWTQQAAAEANAIALDAWSRCESLAAQPSILEQFDERLSGSGYAGDTRAARLVYLVLTSRVLGRPVSAVLKGPSSAGKSYAVERTLEYFPPEAFYDLTAMSERALVYDTEPLVHRILVIYEAAGIAGDMATYLLRSLLSEGRIRYKTVQKTNNGIEPLTIEREGPTGVILTTTAVKLHPENETRLLTIPMSDTREQTAAILRAIASGEPQSVDYEEWRALQTWIAAQDNRVEISFAADLTNRIPPVAVRLRRDVGQLLTLIRAHAVLHQASRNRDERGRIVATLEDYAIVRDLVADIISDGIEATVSPAIRETVSAVAALVDNTDATASVAQLATVLKLDKGAVSRRVQTAAERGYLKNLEDRKGRPARIVLGDPLPDDLVILPDPADLDRCSVAALTEGIESPSPSANGSHPIEKTRPSNRCPDCGLPRGGAHRCSASAAAAVPLPNRLSVGQPLTDTTSPESLSTTVPLGSKGNS